MVLGLYSLVMQPCWEIIAVLVGLTYFTVASASAGACARMRVPVTPVAAAARSGSLGRPAIAGRER
jgi:hypothetical protein